MEVYLLKSAACLGILFLFYKFLLEKENMHVFKRYYLLSAVLVSFIIPFITFTTYVEATPKPEFQLLKTGSGKDIPAVATGSNVITIVLWSIYTFGVLIFSLNFLKNLNSLLRKIKKNTHIRDGFITKVLLQEDVAPHTFWNYIFLNKDKFEQNAIPQEVLEHEQAHARQKHSFDILFLELLQIMLWFYPLIYLVKKAVKLNHEFLADRAVLRKGIATADYQETLLLFSSGHLKNRLVNPIDYSIIKKRFTVMRTKTSKQVVWLKSFLLLPLLAVLVVSFSSNKVVAKAEKNSSAEGKKDLQQENLLIAEDLDIHILNSNSVLLNGKKVALDDVPDKLEGINPHLSKENRRLLVVANIWAEDEVPMEVISEVRQFLRTYGIRQIKFHKDSDSRDNDQTLQEQEEATKAMLREYNRLVRFYNSQENPVIKNDDLKRMNYIYSIMTPEQKEKAEERRFKLPPTAGDKTKRKEKQQKQKGEIGFKISPGNLHKDQQTPPVPAPPDPPAPPATDHPLPPIPPVPSNVEAPTPPPAPPSPIEYMQQLAAEEAIFYYEGKKISGKKAVDLLKELKQMSINVTGEDSEQKVVHISGSRE